MPPKQHPPPLLSYIIEKWIADGWGISPLGFIHYWVNVWSPWGNRVPPWASYFSHAICELMLKNRRCPPLCSYIAKNVWRGGGVQNPWGGWYIYHKITRALINLASYQPAEHGNMTQSNQIYQVFLDFSFVSKTLYLMGKIYSHLNSFEGHLILSNPLIGKTPQKHRSPVL